MKKEIPEDIAGGLALTGKGLIVLSVALVATVLLMTASLLGGIFRVVMRKVRQ